MRLRIKALSCSLESRRKGYKSYVDPPASFATRNSIDGQQKRFEVGALLAAAFSGTDVLVGTEQSSSSCDEREETLKEEDMLADGQEKTAIS
jgi:hypothetical protein